LKILKWSKLSVKNSFYREIEHRTSSNHAKPLTTAVVAGM
jgi:hypothetical protein